jgi:phosphatidylserine/phosphatidylglycerophosphate/cardiolipin synthase-like enzyme
MPIKKAKDGERRVVKGQLASQTAAYRQDHAEREPFAPLRQNNLVECYITGEEYFNALYGALKSATKCIFITGWQVNWDVELVDGVRLIDVLHERIQANKNLRVYVMPWMSPKVGVNTGDLDTMLAIFQLNAGLANMQAFCCPAAGQSDYTGSEGAAFSHHQKAIVVDNKIAFVGGMDVAYGRRDDARFSLDPGARRLNERYNPCVPAVETVEAKHGVTLCTTDLLKSTFQQLKWSAGGDTKPGALRSLLANATAKADQLVMQALTRFVQIDRQSRDAARWIIDRNLVELKNLANMPGNAAVSAARAVSRQCSGYQMADLFGAVQSLRGNSTPSSFEDGVANAETSARETINEALATASSVSSFLAPLKRLQVSTTSQSGLAQAAGTIDRGMQSARNTAVDSVATVAGTIERAGNAALSACVGLAPAVQATVDAAGKGVDDIVRGASLTIDAMVNPIQEALIVGLNRLREVINEQMLGIQELAKNVGDIALSKISQAQIQAVIDQFARLLKTAYVAQLTITWAHAHRHPLLLEKGTKAAASSVLSSTQPRQPWQDVHTRIEGPAVYDVAMNFISRWNACQHSYLKGGMEFGIKDNILPMLKYMLRTGVKIKGEFVPDEPKGNEPAQNVAVRVLRSAPYKMRRQEAEARGDKVLPSGEQCEIQTQMVNLIRNATDFVYIENQFFQTEFGQPSIKPFSDGGRKQLSGPIRYLMSQAMNDVVAKLSSAKAAGKERMPANPIGQALGDRIGHAIRHSQQFHVYIVLPEHPEGKLNDITIVGQVHWTMQSLVFAQKSLVNRIRVAIAARRRCTNPLNAEAWNAAVQQAYGDKSYRDITDQEWGKYLTLLNLRSCEVVGGILRTQQVYVHTKLLVVDDRHVIIGSANINDRSMSGTRDSELAVLLLDTAKEYKMLRERTIVNPLARKLRESLWKKHFALSNNGNALVRPAEDLTTVIDKPASSHAVAAIQKIARENAKVYTKTFDFIPKVVGGAGRSRAVESSSIWPVCPLGASADAAIALEARMPFHEAFWTAQPAAISSRPMVRDYITQLPVSWTLNENNHPGEMSVMVLTEVDNQDEGGSNYV